MDTAIRCLLSLWGIVFNLVMTILGAFVLSRKNVLWNNSFMFLIVFTMFFSGGLIPLYLIVRGVGLIDSIWSVIIPFAVNTFNLIILRTSFMANVPMLLKSLRRWMVRVTFTVFGTGRNAVIAACACCYRLVLCCCAANGIHGLWASVLVTDNQLFPLQLVLRQILIQNSTDSLISSSSANDAFEIGETVSKYATIVTTLPVLCVYPFVQRYFVKGVMIGALKG